VDIARRRDLFVIWADEQVGDVKWTREVVTMKGATFAAQDAELDRVVKAYPSFRRMCMDQTGMGEKPVEDAKRRYGSHRVEGVIMTAPVKQELATVFKRVIEDRQFRAPKNADVRDDFHAVKKVTTVAGNVRFDAERTEQGHSDRFWAAALAVHASDAGTPGMLDYFAKLAAPPKPAEEMAPVAAVSTDRVTVTTKEGW
jgi:phage FluMu gp28-like protein